MSGGEKVEISVYGDRMVFAEMPFVAVVDRRDIENRLPTGLLQNPTQLFVVCYSREQDATTMRPVDWQVAETLAPDAFFRFVDRLEDARRKLREPLEEREAA